MTSHPTPRKISFTGSIATGKHIAASAAPDLKRLTLELGGNDPAILLDDVDPAAIVEKLFRGAFDNSGQVCSAIKRLYVPEALHDQVADALAARVAAARVGDGMDPDTELGPVQNRPQYERVGAVAERLECGTAWVNTHVALGPHQPFGGARWSGLGVENGPWGLAGYTDIQVQHRARG